MLGLVYVLLLVSHLTTVSVRKTVLGKYAEADFRLLR